jgi:hypothetical protein
LRSPRNAKLMMVSALCLMVLAGVMFLLLVVPAMRGGAPVSMAQDEDGTAMPMDADMPPDMPPDMPGEPGMDAPAEEAAPEPEPSEKGPPIEPSSPKPFSGAGVAPGVAGEVALEDMRVTNYGSNWSSIPITQRVGFPSPDVPPRRPAPPPPSVIGPEKPLRVTSIMWTQDGQALAVYEYGEGEEMQSGVVRPGDVVDTWKTVEIRRDHIVVEDRKSGAKSEVFITEKAPEPKRPEPTTRPERPGVQRESGDRPRPRTPRPGGRIR